MQTGLAGVWELGSSNLGFVKVGRAEGVRRRRGSSSGNRASGRRRQGQGGGAGWTGDWVHIRHQEARHRDASVRVQHSSSAQSWECPASDMWHATGAFGALGMSAGLPRI